MLWGAWGSPDLPQPIISLRAVQYPRGSLGQQGRPALYSRRGLGAWPEGCGQQGADFRAVVGSQGLRQDVEGPRVKEWGCLFRGAVGPREVAERKASHG